MEIYVLIKVLAVIQLTIICNGQLQIMPISNEKEERSPVLNIKVENSNLSSNDLKTVFNVVKNISRSRGPRIESEDGEVEFRRSFVKSVSLEAKLDVLKRKLKRVQSDDPDTISTLNDIEFLVHQFEVALDFVKLGGIELVLPFTKHQDSKISAMAFSVMTAAMQGNPAVQEHANRAGILNFIIDAINSNPRKGFPSVLYTISTYLRNMPTAQLTFYQNNGISLLTNIIKSQNEALKYKLKVIDLLSDLSTEIYASSSKEYTKELLMLFKDSIQRSGLCFEIPYFLAYTEFLIHEKIVAAMNSLFPVCPDDFSKPYIIDIVLKLESAYNPQIESIWYSKLDPEFMWLLSENLKSLYEKITYRRFRRKSEL